MKLGVPMELRAGIHRRTHQRYPTPREKRSWALNGSIAELPALPATRRTSGLSVTFRFRKIFTPVPALPTKPVAVRLLWLVAKGHLRGRMRRAGPHQHEDLRAFATDNVQQSISHKLKSARAVG